jgi:2-keto-4-pentenoate hydratase/2-oxohepta-3-ene-1,7-dioic acid hydratase in catechol pathway
MRLCRFRHQGAVEVGLYRDDVVVPLSRLAEVSAPQVPRAVSFRTDWELLDYLPPDGPGTAVGHDLAAWAEHQGGALAELAIPTSRVELLVPIPRPNKLFLLAGNYAEHVVEGGGRAPERESTFPYVFMKPPSTTLTDPGKPVRLPRISPAAIDWELELGVVIGRRARYVPEAEALSFVGGYTVINDISNRKFRPNPARQAREKDAFFDWLHGKWFDSFCPCGPCLATADSIPNPQQLEMSLSVNGQARQQGSTGQMIFPVAALIEFISGIVTLEPGDIISTGTPAGVGAAKGTFLAAGDRIEARIQSIGTLVSVVESE